MAVKTRSLLVRKDIKKVRRTLTSINFFCKSELFFHLQITMRGANQLLWELIITRMLLINYNSKNNRPPVLSTWMDIHCCMFSIVNIYLKPMDLLVLFIENQLWCRKVQEFAKGTYFERNRIWIYHHHKSLYLPWDFFCLIKHRLWNWYG